MPIADNLLGAWELMAFTLGFHIILSCIGVALPAMMLIAEYRGRKHGDEDASGLGRGWQRALRPVLLHRLAQKQVLE